MDDHRLVGCDGVGLLCWAWQAMSCRRAVEGAGGQPHCPLEIADAGPCPCTKEQAQWGPVTAQGKGLGLAGPVTQLSTAWKNSRGVVTENVLKARFFKGTRVIEGVAWQPHRPG
jgi:hypothetical protein